MIKRFLGDAAFSANMGRQMRFITGPRQAGKTTMAKEKLSAEKCEKFYYNWDSQQVKRQYRRDGDFLAPELIKKKGGKVWVCFDEIHKMPKWKNIVKDFFDSHENEAVFIVTGSAKLDVFRKTGDSLAGRYFPFRLNPLMLAEISGSTVRNIMDTGTAAGYIEKRIKNSRSAASLMEQILGFSGFPEPCLKKNRVFAAKWHDNYFERFIREDIRDISSIHQLEKISDLISMVPSRIGSPLSVNSLKEDLELNHATVKNYIKYLKLTYVLFEVEPYTKKINKPVKKEKKAYLYNIAVIKDEGAKFENYAALELRALIDLWNDTQEGKYELKYVRTRDKKETDFLILKNNEPYFLAEAKLNEEKIERHHFTHMNVLGGIPFVQLVKKHGVVKKPSKNVYVISASEFFS